MAFRMVVAGLALSLFCAPASALADISIKVDLSDQTMIVRTGFFQPTYTWKVSTARQGHETPTGTYRPQVLKEMHYSKLYNRSPMPFSIFFSGDYAIHGTAYVKSLGKPASHGCIRLHTDNARMLFEMVRQAGRGHTTIRIVP